MAGASRRIRPVWLAWVLLMMASGLGFALANGVGSARIASIEALLLAAAKIHLIFDHYMEVSWKHQPLRLILQVWLLAVIAILAITYIIE